jgi:cystathionine gamma-synthase
LPEFYNRLEMLKSPSFGTEFSNCCPYVYLAHYPMMQTREGKDQLEQAGIPENLLRLSVGLEPVEEIIGALRSPSNKKAPRSTGGLWF